MTVLPDPVTEGLAGHNDDHELIHRGRIPVYKEYAEADLPTTDPTGSAAFVTDGTRGPRINRDAGFWVHLDREVIDVKRDFKCKGNDSDDDTDKLNAAFAAADEDRQYPVYMPPGAYKVSDSLLIPNDNFKFYGPGGQLNLGGAEIRWYAYDSAIPCIQLINPATYANNVRLQDFAISSVGSATPTYLAGADGIQLTAPTNQSSIHRVMISRMRGNAVTVANAPAGDPNGACNFVAEQLFVSRCAGWGFDNDGYPTVTFILPDFNNCGKGGFRFVNGVNNQSTILIMGLWCENGMYGTGETDYILIENSSGRQPITLVGCNFSGNGAVAGANIVRATGTGGVNATFVNCVQNSWTNWLLDSVNSETITATASINYSRDQVTTTLSARGASAFNDTYDTSGGTANSRRWRWGLSGTSMVLTSRNDDGTGKATLLTTDLSSGKMTVVNELEMDGALNHDGSTAGFFGVAPAARPAATDDIKDGLAALGLLTNGGATPLDLDGGALTTTGDAVFGPAGVLDAGVALQVSGNASEKVAVLRANATTPGNVLELQNSAGTPLWQVSGSSGAQTLADGINLIYGTTTGTKFGTLTTMKLGFWGATPIVRPSAYTQTYSTTTKTHANLTSADISAFTGGTVGFLDAAERDNLRTQINALRADLTNTKSVLNAVVDDLQAIGLVG